MITISLKILRHNPRKLDPTIQNSSIQRRCGDQCYLLTSKTAGSETLSSFRAVLDADCSTKGTQVETCSPVLVDCKRSLSRSLDSDLLTSCGLVQPVRGAEAKDFSR